MYTTYHLPSAQEINSDFLDSIKATFKSKPITIIVEEDFEGELSAEEKRILDERKNDSEEEYITAEESIKLLKSEYGL